MSKIRSCVFLSLIFIENNILPRINSRKGGSVFEYVYPLHATLSFNSMQLLWIRTAVVKKVTGNCRVREKHPDKQPGRLKVSVSLGSEKFSLVGRSYISLTCSYMGHIQARLLTPLYPVLALVWKDHVLTIREQFQSLFTIWLFHDGFQCGSHSMPFWAGTFVLQSWDYQLIALRLR